MPNEGVTLDRLPVNAVSAVRGPNLYVTPAQARTGARASLVIFLLNILVKSPWEGSPSALVYYVNTIPRERVHIWGPWLHGKARGPLKRNAFETAS